MKREKDFCPAMINGKDVTTDWIEEVFDDDCAVKDGNMMIGFINHKAVQVSWERNTLSWIVSNEFGVGDPAFTLLVLRERLIALETEEQNVFSVITKDFGKNKLRQKFYFKEG